MLSWKAVSWRHPQALALWTLDGRLSALLQGMAQGAKQRLQPHITRTHLSTPMIYCVELEWLEPGFGRRLCALRWTRCVAVQLTVPLGSAPTLQTRHTLFPVAATSLANGCDT